MCTGPWCPVRAPHKPFFLGLGRQCVSHPQAASDSATGRQQTDRIQQLQPVGPERPSVSEWAPRPEQTRRDRTEQAIFSHWLWLNSLFSQRWPWNCSVSLHERHPGGMLGSKASEQIVEVGLVGRRDWTLYKKNNNKAEENQLMKSQPLRSGLLSLVSTRWQTSRQRQVLGWHVCISAAALDSSRRGWGWVKRRRPAWLPLVWVTFPQP